VINGARSAAGIRSPFALLASWREKRDGGDISQRPKDAKRTEDWIEKMLGVLAREGGEKKLLAKAQRRKDKREAAQKVAKNFPA